MADVELERLLVRLDGDARGYTRMLQEAKEAALQAAEVIGVALSFREALSAFAEVEAGAVRLNAVLTANGRDVGATTARFRELADQIERNTTVGRAEVMGMLTQATTMGLSARQAEEATRQALALAAATGGSAEHLLHFTEAIAKGDIAGAMMYKRMVPGFRDIRDQAEMMAKVQSLVTAGQAAMEAQTRTVSGQFQILKRDVGHLLEEFGKFVAEAIRPAVQGVQDLVKWFRDLDDGMKRNLVLLAGTVSAFLLLGPALKVLSILGLSVFNPLLFVVGAVGVAISIFVQRAGGIGPAIDQARTSVNRFIRENEALLKQLAIAGAVIAGLVLSYKLLEASHLIAVGSWAVHAAAVVAWTAVVLLAKGAALLFGFAVFAVSSAIGALTATLAIPLLAGIALAVVAAYRAFKDLAGQLREVQFQARGFGQMADIFGEWGKMLASIGHAATISFDGAWKMLVAAGQLAVSQITDMWPPVWELLRSGFGALGIYLRSQFMDHMQALLAFAEAVGNAFAEGLVTGTFALDAAATDQIARAARNNAQVFASTFQRDVAEAMRRFTIPESTLTTGLRRTFREIQAEMDWKEALSGDNSLAAAGNDAADAFKGAEDKIKDTKDAVNELKASLLGSVEAEAKVADYLNDLYRPIGPAGASAAASLQARGIRSTEPQGPPAPVDTLHAQQQRANPTGVVGSSAWQGNFQTQMTQMAADARAYEERQARAERNAELLLQRAVDFLRDIAGNNGPIVNEVP